MSLRSIVTAKVQVSTSPPLSVQVQVTMLSPIPVKKEPVIGLQVTTRDPSTCSVSVQEGFVHTALLPTFPCNDSTITRGGQVITGGVFASVNSKYKIITHS